MTSPKNTAKQIAAASEGSYTYFELQAATGTCPRGPGTAVVHVGVAEALVAVVVAAVVAALDRAVRTEAAIVEDIVMGKPLKRAG